MKTRTKIRLIIREVIEIKKVSLREWARIMKEWFFWLRQVVTGGIVWILAGYAWFWIFMSGAIVLLGNLFCNIIPKEVKKRKRKRGMKRLCSI